MYTVGLILHCRTVHRVLWSFGATDFVTLVLFYVMLHSSFVFDPIHWIVLGKFLIHSFM